MDDLVQFLRDRFDEDVLWATEASRIEGIEQAPEGGVHWRWVSDDTDEELTPDPSKERTVGYETETSHVSLRSCEEWPSPSSDTPLPQFVLHTEEPHSASAGHIIRHDPARVLVEIDAKRSVLDLAERARDHHETFVSGFAAALENTLRLHALAYADHPDYRTEWRP